MPRRPSKNTVAKLIEFPQELAVEVEGFAKSRGETFKKVTTDALRRHLDNPPPPPVTPSLPPLPPFPPEPPAPAIPAAKKPRKAKGK